MGALINLIFVIIIIFKMMYHIYYLTGYVFSKKFICLQLKMILRKIESFCEIKIKYKSKCFLLLLSSSALSLIGCLLIILTLCLPIIILTLLLF